MIIQSSQPSRPLGRSPLQTPLICLGLAALVFAVFGQTLGFEFTNYDDNKIVFENPHVRCGLNFENMYWALVAGTGSYKADIDYWRPLSLISHLADIQCFGIYAGWHHAVSVLFHAVSSVLLFLVLSSMTGAVWRSAMVAALFAIHPLHVESVAWIAERKDVLSGLFFILTLGAYTRYARRPSRPFPMASYLLVLFCSALAMMSKPMVVTMPCLLLLLDYWPLERTEKASWLRLIIEKVPLLIMSLGVAWVTTHAAGGVNSQLMELITLPWRLGMAVVAYATYLKQMLWPFALGALYPHPANALPIWSIWVSLATILFISMMVFWQRKRRYLCVGWLWYLGMLVPVIGIVQSGGQAHADRYTYLPLIGVFIMIVWTLEEWSEKSPQRRLFLAYASVAVVMIFTLLAARQTKVWRNSIFLWSHSLACGVESSLIHNNLGEALIASGKTEEGTPHILRALEINPNDSDAHSNLGEVFLMQGHIDQAIDEFHKGLAVDHVNTITLNALGEALMMQGKSEEATSEFREAIRLNPYHMKAIINLGDALFKLGDQSHATESFRKAITLDPANAAVIEQKWGRLLYQDGKRQDGISKLEHAYLLHPEKLGVVNDLSWMLATVPEESLRNGPRSLELALAVDRESGGKDPFFLDTLAAAYAENRNFKQALRTSRHALKLAESSENKELVKSLREEISLYEVGKPVRNPQ